jgi:hypothetical protein
MPERTWTATSPLTRLENLEAEIERLQTENAELRCRLGVNSNNSYKPPSSDGYRKNRARSALPKEKRSFGGQKGHNGKTPYAVEKLDQVVVHPPKVCKRCGRSFEGERAQRVVPC